VENETSREQKNGTLHQIASEIPCMAVSALCLSPTRVQSSLATAEPPPAEAREQGEPAHLRTA